MDTSSDLLWDVANRAQLAFGEIDGGARSLKTGDMSQATITTPRRSARVFHRMRIQAHGRAHNGRKFRENCETVVINAHGALLSIAHEVDDGALLVLVNPETQEEQECRVVFLGEPTNKGQRVGIEFLTPAPHFWGVDFDAPSTRSEEVH